MIYIKGSGMKWRQTSIRYYAHYKKVHDAKTKRDQRDGFQLNLIKIIVKKKVNWMMTFIDGLWLTNSIELLPHWAENNMVQDQNNGGPMLTVQILQMTRDFAISKLYHFQANGHFMSIIFKHFSIIVRFRLSDATRICSSCFTRSI